MTRALTATSSGTVSSHPLNWPCGASIVKVEGSLSGARARIRIRIRILGRLR